MVSDSNDGKENQNNSIDGKKLDDDKGKLKSAGRVNHAWYSPIEKIHDENHKRSNYVELKDIGKVIDSFERSSSPDVRLAMQVARIQSAWEKIAPQEVLNHTDDVYVYKRDDGRHLVVYVDSSAWAAELSATKERFRRDMEKELGGDPIDDIRFSPSRTVKEHHDFKKLIDAVKVEPDMVPNVSLTDDERNKLMEEASVIENCKIRESFLKARIADAEWKKGIEASKRR